MKLNYWKIQGGTQRIKGVYPSTIILFDLFELYLFVLIYTSEIYLSNKG